MKYIIILLLLFLFPTIIHAQTDLDALLAPIDFLEDQQYILEITQLETQQNVAPSSLTTQELTSFNEYGYAIRRMGDIHFSLDTTLKSFDLVPGTREDMSPTTMNITTSDSTRYQLVASLTKVLQTPSGYTIPITYTLDESTYKPFNLNEYVVLESTKLGLSVFPSIDQPLGTYGATIQVIALPW